ncbi:MAG: hypothetical protein F6K17_13350 [Okeania sp. SIO3C4]|nr:hypothetical protein [Okeania sp. SIO3C4]
MFSRTVHYQDGSKSTSLLILVLIISTTRSTIKYDLKLIYRSENYYNKFYNIHHIGNEYINKIHKDTLVKFAPIDNFIGNNLK